MPSFLAGGQHPHLQPHPLDHPVLRAPDIWGAAQEEHAAAAAGQGPVRLAAEGAHRHQRQEEVPEGAAGAAVPRSAAARQVPGLNPPPVQPRVSREQTTTDSSPDGRKPLAARFADASVVSLQPESLLSLSG